MAWIRSHKKGSGGAIDYNESWVIMTNTTDASMPTKNAHIEYSNGAMTSIDVRVNEGNSTVVNGDITTFIGNASGWKWKVTATANMKIRLYDMINETLGDLQTISANTDIITDAPSNTDYCMEIRRYE